MAVADYNSEIRAKARDSLGLGGRLQSGKTKSGFLLTFRDGITRFRSVLQTSSY